MKRAQLCVLLSISMCVAMFVISWLSRASEGWFLFFSAVTFFAGAIFFALSVATIIVFIDEFVE